MIYSNYNESAVAIDYLKDAKKFGITVPSTRTCLEQNLFISGIAESAMLDAFEKIGTSEKAYFESGVEVVRESVFDSIKEVFAKIIEAIKSACEKVIAWFVEKSHEFGKYLREKALDKWFDKINQIKVTDEKVEKAKVLCKTNMKESLDDPNKLQTGAKTMAQNASKFAQRVIDSIEEYDDASSLKKAATSAILGGAEGDSMDSILKNLKKEFIAEKPEDVTVAWALANAKVFKEVVLAGKQKYFIKKCFTDEKAEINKSIAELKKYADKDDKSVRSRVARAKDVSLAMDACYRTYMDLIKNQYAESRKILVSLAQYASSVAKSKDKDEKKKEVKNESVDYFYM